MNRKIVLLSVLVASVVILSPAWRLPQDKLPAVILKVKNVVEKTRPTSGWTKAVPLDQLANGQQVRTDANSIALIQFSDQTKLILREKSIAEIKGQIQGREIIDRSVNMTRGNVRFDVKKSEKEQFRFSSPISVASIRGTIGAYIADNDSLNKLIIEQGLATLLSLISNRSEDVGDNQTGLADDQGNVSVRESNPDERGETGDQEFQDDPPGTRKVLRIPGEDRDGNPRTIIIEWEEPRR
ncbi:MAG: FecR family protein [Bacteroidota bacterium]